MLKKLSFLHYQSTAISNNLFKYIYFLIRLTISLSITNYIFITIKLGLLYKKPYDDEYLYMQVYLKSRKAGRIRFMSPILYTRG